MIYETARFADEAHTLVTGTDAIGNTETVPVDHTVFRCLDDGPVGFVNNGGVIEPFAAFPSLEAAIAAKLAELDEYRWQVEVGGVAFRGSTIRTDSNSQAKITAVYTMARLDPEYDVPTWEVTPGIFIPLDNNTIIAMGDAVRDHIQGTFTRKAQLHPIIAGLASINAVEAFNIEAEWRNND